MKHLTLTMLLSSSLLCAAAAAQKPAPSLPIPGYGTAKDVPGAHELPDPKLTYKVLFKLTKAADKPEAVNPELEDVARLVNTLSKYGVAESHRKFAVIIYGEATDIILNDDAFRSRHKGQANPNIPLMRSLTRAGVEFKVCGQAVLYHGIDPKTIQPEVELDLAAWTTMLNLETRGYILLGD